MAAALQRLPKGSVPVSGVQGVYDATQVVGKTVMGRFVINGRPFHLDISLCEELERGKSYALILFQLPGG